jgi:diguanylate cyclase (GGDEF)-like protein
VAFTPRGALLIADSGDGEALAIVLEDLDQPMYDRLMTQFNLQRMVSQVGVLVNRIRYIARLEDLGRTDGLTGLPNRRALEDHLEQAHLAARRRGEQLSVVMIDLDNFKIFNDSFGHLAGDDLLRSYAARLRSRLRSTDFVARYGGEEFLVVLPGTDADGAERAFAELHRTFRHADDLSGVTFSAGVAAWDGAESTDELISRADRALYAAKAGGRDRTVVDTADGRTSD